MANRPLIAALLLLALAAVSGQTPTPAPPSSGIMPIKNGKLFSPLDANNFQIQNLDTSNLPSGGGGGGGGGLSSITGDDGIATGITLTISHVTGTNLTDPIFTLGGTLGIAHGGTGQTDFSGAASLIHLGVVVTGTWNANAIDAAFLPALNSITAPTGNVSFNSHKGTGVADPSAGTDIANKNYVDSVANAGPPHPFADVASTANLTRTGEQTIDGITTSASRVLLKNQTAGAENGLYVSAAGAWTRATDADTGAEVSGSVFVNAGTTQAGQTWGVTTPQPITLDTTAIAYTLTGTASVYTASGGINLTAGNFTLAPMAAGSVKGNNTGGAAGPTDIPFATLKTAIGAENALTFSPPFTRGGIGGNTIGILTASTTNAGQLLAADFLNFQNKVPPSRTLQATAPLRITNNVGTPVSGPGNAQDLGTNRAFDIPPATNSVDGYLTAADHASFVSKSPGDSQINFTNTGTTSTPSTLWTTGATAAYETTAIAVTDKYAFLPPSTAYAPGKRITYTDGFTTGNFGRFLRPATGSGDFINNSASDFRPFIAGATGPFGRKSVEFEAVTASGGVFAGWQVVNTASNLFSVQDPSDATKVGTFVVAGPSVMTWPASNFTGIIPSDSSDPTTSVVTGSGDDGALNYSTIQTVPTTSGHSDGEVLTIAGGIPTFGPGANASGFIPLTQAAPTVWIPQAGKTDQNAQWQMTGDGALQISNVSNTLVSGMVFNLLVKQSGSGSCHLTFDDPSLYRTGTNTLGVVGQTLTANAQDFYQIRYTGIPGSEFVVSNQTLNLTHAVPASCVTAGLTQGGSATTSTAGAVGSSTANAWKSNQFVATATETVCSVDVNLFRSTANATQALSASIYADTVRSGTGGHLTNVATTSGSDTISTATAASWGGNDQGAHIHISAGFAATDYYIAAVTDATHIRISSDKAGTAFVTASSTTTATTDVYGMPGTSAISTSNNTPSASSLPSDATGAGATVTHFTGLSAALTSGTTYHVVVNCPFTNGTDFVTWIYDATNTSGVANGYQFRTSSTGTSGWGVATNKVRARFTLIH